MELDLAGIHQLAAGQGIDAETLDDALSEALRLAYLKTPHAAKHVRVELDERAGTFTIWAQDEFQSNRLRTTHPAPQLGRSTTTLRAISAVWPRNCATGHQPAVP